MEDDILAAIREGYKRTNLKDVDLGAYQPQDPLHRLAVMIHIAPDVSNQNFGEGFSGAKSYFLHKFIDQATISTPFTLRSEDFFKGAIFVDYLCNAILGSHDFLRRQSFGGRGIGDVVRASRSTFPEARRGEYYATHNPELPPYASVMHTSLMSKIGAQLLLEHTPSPVCEQLYGLAKGIMDLKAGFFIGCIASVGENFHGDEILARARNEGLYRASLAAFADLYRVEAEQRINAILRI